VAERWATERAHLLPLPPRPFDCARRVDVRATSTAEVAFETNRYSVPSAQAHRPLLLKADVDTVRVYAGATLVAEHPRCYAQHRRISDWRHYVPVLARKPGAVPFAAALREGDRPPAFEQFRQELCARQADGNRAFVRVLELALRHPLALVAAAVEQALACRAYHADAVVQLLEQALTPDTLPPPLDPARYPDLPAVRLAPVSSAAYDRLRRGGGA
jgi:hypothetical protein